jgi:hypothetical protein
MDPRRSHGENAIALDGECQTTPAYGKRKAPTMAIGLGKIPKANMILQVEHVNPRKRRHDRNNKM